jgi:shikimate dehydrogenase
MSIEITGNTGLLAVLGAPIKHTHSPQVHNAAFDALGLDYKYLAFDVGTEELEKAIEGLRVLKTKGFSVTMPNKLAVIPYLDKLSREAELCGSVNCVVNEDGSLVGYNTDGYGFVQTLMDKGVAVKGQKMTLIGTGGVSAAICTQCALDGMKEIALFGIKDATFENGIKLAERINKETNCKINICELSNEKLLKENVATSTIFANATPVGMGRMEGMSPVNDDMLFFSELAVMDVIYNPGKTKFLEMAEAKGCKIINGQDMLLWQGAKSFNLWTGKEMPIEVARPFL